MTDDLDLSVLDGAQAATNAEIEQLAKESTSGLVRSLLARIRDERQRATQNEANVQAMDYQTGKFEELLDTVQRLQDDVRFDIAARVAGGMVAEFHTRIVCGTSVPEAVSWALFAKVVRRASDALLRELLSNPFQYPEQPTQDQGGT